jgi:peptidylprolyl isomerase
MDELVKVVGRDEFPADIEPEVGQQLQMELNDGRQVIVVVTEISELGVTLDANHPLAGKDLTFDIQLVDII